LDIDLNKPSFFMKEDMCPRVKTVLTVSKVQSILIDSSLSAYCLGYDFGKTGTKTSVWRVH